MRVRILNPDADDPFAITATQWAAATTRHKAAALSRTDGNDAHILIAPPGVLARALPLAMPDLRMIFLTASGPDRLMPFIWLPDGVLLVNNRGVHGSKVGDYVLMALLMLGNAMPHFAAAQRAQTWAPRFTPVLRGKRVTIIGTGDLGQSAARAAATRGMIPIGVNTRGALVDGFDAVFAVDALDACLPTSDFLVLACPLTAATRGMINRDRLTLLPKGAGVINVGRGALLNTEALCDLLEQDHIGGAVCDVFDPEPIAADDRLWTTRNLVITPHVAADDPASYNDDSLDIFFRNLAAWRAGTPLPNLIDLARGY